MQKMNIRRCRLCASEENFDEFTSIFGGNPQLQLELKITKLLPVVVMPWDPMTHLICSQCVDKLNAFDDFYETALKADRFFKAVNAGLAEDRHQVQHPLSEVFDNHSLRLLPPKKRQTRGEGDVSEERGNLMTATKTTTTTSTSECFIIKQITNKDFVFTCRECFRTFTKQSSAFSHSCVRLEDCEEINSILVEEKEDEKSLPPLKIRLFSMKSGLFVCYMCKAMFEEKENLMEHLKSHFGNRENGGREKKCTRGKRKRRSGSLEGEEEEEESDWEELYFKKSSKRSRKSSTPSRKKRRPKTIEHCECQTNLSSATPTPEKVDGTTQYLSTDVVVDVTENEAASPFKPEVTSTVAISIREEVPEEVAFIPEEAPPVPEELQTKHKKEIVEEGEEKKTPPDEDIVEIESELETTVVLEEEADIVEISNDSIQETKPEEVTVLEVLEGKTRSRFVSCVFCDKVFASKDALITHQNRHLLSCGNVKTEDGVMPVGYDRNADQYLCSICAMMFVSQQRLLEHEEYHMVDMDSISKQRKIRIALDPELSERSADQDAQKCKARGIITITVTAAENKIPQIEFV